MQLASNKLPGMRRIGNAISVRHAQQQCAVAARQLHALVCDGVVLMWKRDHGIKVTAETRVFLRARIRLRSEGLPDCMVMNAGD